MSLLEKLKKNSTIKETAVLKTSKLFEQESKINTNVPALNIALSGEIDGGLTSGITVLSGPSKHFKSGATLIMVKAYLDKYKEGVCLFYDSEFGTPQSYFDTFGIDMNRVIHTPVTNLEELKFDLMNQLDNINRGDKIIIALDSFGNLASKKEVDDALDQKSVADMTRAKVGKGLFRMITPHLKIKQIPMLVIAHTYQTQEMYSKTILAGGCLEAGTKLQLADGELREIELIQVGDFVKTLDGPKEVTSVWNPETLEVGEPECFEIEFEDGYRCVVSETHPFLVDGKWVEAKDLSGSENITQI